MAVLIYLMDSYSDKQQPFRRDVLIEYAQSIAMIDLHIVSFSNSKREREEKNNLYPQNKTYIDNI